MLRKQLLSLLKSRVICKSLSCHCAVPRSAIYSTPTGRYKNTCWLLVFLLKFYDFMYDNNIDLTSGIQIC